MGRRRRKGRSCAFESLEDRSLLAGDVMARILNGDLLIKGDKLANGITIAPGTAANTVVVTGVNAGSGATNVNGTSNGPVTLSGFTGGLRIRMKGGNDNVTINGLNVSGAVDIDGGKGDDTFTITGGTFSSSLGIDLGKGADNLTITNLKVTGNADIHGHRGRDHVTITNSMFGSLDTSLGRGNDILDITGTTVTSTTALNGGRGTNTFNNGTGNTLNGLSNTHFAVGSGSPDLTTPAGSPVLSISGTASINEASVYTLNLSASGTGASTITKWTITWGDGSAAQVVNGNPATVTHTFADGGASRTISATATNSDGTFNAGNTVTVAVNNVAPALSISGAASVNKGVAYTLNLSATDPGADTISKWTVNWGDGSAAQVVMGNPTSVTHTFTDAAAARTISATATDEDGTFNAANTVTVSVNEFAPLLTLTGPTNINEGTLYTLGLSSSGAGASSITVWTINWGDGSAPQALSGNPANVTHTFPDGFATRTISATATNGTTTLPAGNTVSVTVTNVAPFVTIGGATNVNEGSLYTLNLSSSDPGADTIRQWTINWGDNTPTQTVNGHPASVTHTFVDGNVIRTILATATDEDGTYAANSFPVIVNNVVPTLRISGASNVLEAATYTLKLSSSDPGADTIQRWTINWGDGLPTEIIVGNPTSATHVYSDGPATRTISATATDEDDTFAALNTVTVTVGDVAPLLTISGPASANEGNFYSLNLASSDVGADTISSWAINWGDGSPIDTIIGNPSTATHVFADGPNLFTITATATNEDGTFAATNAVDVSVQNIPPSVPFSGPSVVTEGTRTYWTLGPFYFNQGDDTISTVIVHWGDGQVETYPLGQVLGYNTLPHTYDDGPNAYTITIDLIDEDGTFPATATLDVTVNNAGPSVSLLSPDPVVEGGTGSVAGTYTDLGRSDSHTLTVAWGDPDSTSPSTFELPAILGPTDPASLHVGDTFTSSTDGAVLTITSIDCDSGLVGFSVTGHVYQDDHYSTAIEITVVDSDGESGSSTTGLYIINASPDVTLEAPAPITEGESILLTGAFSDVGKLDTHILTLTWNVAGESPMSSFALPALQDATGQPQIHVGDTFQSTVDSAVMTITSIDAAAGQIGFSLMHRYFASSDYSYVAVHIVDDDNGYDDSYANLSIANATPTLRAEPIADIAEGGIATLNAAFTDVGIADTHTMVISWLDASTYTYTSYSYYAIPTIQDSSGNITLHVGDNFMAFYGDNSVLTITSVDPTTGDVGFSVQHQYFDDSPPIGNGTSRADIKLSINVSDEQTGIEMDATVRVTNVAPTLALDAVINTTEGSPATLTGTFTDPGLLDEHTLTVNWGDPNNSNDPTFILPSVLTTYGAQWLVPGPNYYSTDYTAVLAITSVDLSTGAVSFSIQHWYLDDGPRAGNATESDLSLITATVTDDDGELASDKRFITVNNAAPTLALDSPSAIHENGTVTLTGSYTDPGLLDGQTLIVNWDDPNNSAPSTFQIPAIQDLEYFGTFYSTTDYSAITVFALSPGSGQINFQVSHQYLDDGIAPGNGTSSDVSTIQVTVTDDDGQSGSGEQNLFVSNAPPVLDLGFLPFTPTNATLATYFNDSGLLDPHTLSIAWGDIKNPSTFSLPAARTAEGAANLHVADIFRSSTDTATLTITAIDESTGRISFTVGHQYENAGNPTLEFTLTDDDGGPDLRTISWFVYS
jgi:hypothetical protein